MLGGRASVFKQSEGTKACETPYLGRPSDSIGGGNSAEPREICVVVGGGSWNV